MNKSILQPIVILLLAASGMLMACNSYDDAFEAGTGQTPIASPVVTCNDATYRTLSFEWQAVNDAVSYSYQLTDAEGEKVDGGVTTSLQATFDRLQSAANYTLTVIAYPALHSGKGASQPAKVEHLTGLIDNEGTMTSSLTNTSWTSRLKETSLNTFVLSTWYGNDDYELEFSVNAADSTINVTNGVLDEATGRMRVATGSNKIMVKNGVLIDGGNSKFDRLSGILTLDVQATTGTKKGTDVFTF
ncbi:MAG: fibronectin type III domain-containing protein [Prevotella sp.]